MMGNIWDWLEIWVVIICGAGMLVSMIYLTFWGASAVYHFAHMRQHSKQ